MEKQATKFTVGNQVSAEHKGQGTIIDIQMPGQFKSLAGKMVRSGTSSGTEVRYQVQWARMKTWFRESALSFVSQS